MGVMLLCFRSDGAGRRVGESQPHALPTATRSGAGSAHPSERQMGSRPKVVRDVLREHPVQPRRVHHDDMIEAFASNRADDALHVGVLPR